MNRAIAILVIVTALIGLVSGLVIGYGENKFQAGIDHQKALQDDADDKAESEAVTALKAEKKAIEEEKKAWKEKADYLDSLGPKIIYEEIEIEKIIQVDSCTDRGDAFVMRWNKRNEKFLLGVSVISQ